MTTSDGAPRRSGRTPTTVGVGGGNGGGRVSQSGRKKSTGAIRPARFTCDDCGASFGTPQALGGHRSQHVRGNVTTGGTFSKNSRDYGANKRGGASASSRGGAGEAGGVGDGGAALRRRTSSILSIDSAPSKRMKQKHAVDAVSDSSEDDPELIAERLKTVNARLVKEQESLRVELRTMGRMIGRLRSLGVMEEQTRPSLYFASKRKRKRVIKAYSPEGRNSSPSQSVSQPLPPPPTPEAGINEKTGEEDSTLAVTQTPKHDRLVMGADGTPTKEIPEKDGCLAARRAQRPPQPNIRSMLLHVRPNNSVTGSHSPSRHPATIPVAKSFNDVAGAGDTNVAKEERTAEAKEEESGKNLDCEGSMDDWEKRNVKLDEVSVDVSSVYDCYLHRIVSASTAAAVARVEDEYRDEMQSLRSEVAHLKQLKQHNTCGDADAKIEEGAQQLNGAARHSQISPSGGDECVTVKGEVDTDAVFKTTAAGVVGPA